MTGHGREEIIREARASGIADILLKPVNQSVLFDCLIGVLGRNASDQVVGRSPAPSAQELQQWVAGLTDLRVLLVEDNEVNQEVALGMLEAAGMRVTVADNGQVALEAVLRQPFDLVLMDMQMPVMDGLTATRLMHEKLSERCPPVIAMTANVMQEDRDRCMEAGMNDYLTKPLYVAALTLALERWMDQPGVGGSASAVDTAPAVNAVQDAEPALMDFERLAQFKGMRPVNPY